MNKKLWSLANLSGSKFVKIFSGAACALAICLAPLSSGAVLLSFPFNEGAGTVTTDEAGGWIGQFGFVQDPETDTPSIASASPSGLAGDTSVSVHGNGYLVVDDSDNPVLAFGPDDPITVEAWISVTGEFLRANEGILTYGNSYKLGLRQGELVWTLFGIVDVRSGLYPLIGEWQHVAAVFEPGVGVTFYLNEQTAFVAETRRVPAYSHHYLIIGAERFSNSIVALIDRVRVHGAALSAEQIDNDAATPQPLLADTAVAYNFDETELPAQNATQPARPTVNSVDLVPMLSGPAWTSDTPSGAEGDYAVAFNLENPPIRQRITVDLTADPLDLAVNNTNYTLEAWVKLPTTLINERMVIFRTSGPAPRVSLSINANRTLHTTMYGTQDFTSSVRVPNDSRWHHIAVVMEDFVRVRFYLDGVLRQTVNKTGTGTASSASAANLLIGMESDTRYFKGTLDRLRIHDTALAAEALDFPAIPGLPRLLSAPEDAVADQGGQVTFAAEASSATSYQWRHRASLSDSEGTDIPGATTTTLTLNNVTLADQGFYSLVARNDIGATESYAARLMVRTAPGTLQPLWTILPDDDRPYVTGWNSAAANRDLERGMGYNPVTDHLLIGARVDSPTIKGIFIVDAETGAHVGELPSSDEVPITGGTIVLTRVVVADDGAIYACNFGTLTDANPLKIYRWADETSAPTLAYQGNPVTGTGLANQQWGKNMQVRGAGMNTQILMDTRSNWLALFTTEDGVTFTPELFQPEARNDAWNLGLAWGAGDTFWGKNSFEPLFQWELNPAGLSAPQLREYPDFPGESFSNFSFDETYTMLGGLNIVPGPDLVELYDMSDLVRGPVLVDSAAFSLDNSHTVNYGNVWIAGGRLFALNPNNGVIAFRIGGDSIPELEIQKTENTVVISWPASFSGFVLESTDALPGTSWTEVPHEAVGDENRATVNIDDDSQFFRLRK